MKTEWITRMPRAVLILLIAFLFNGGSVGRSVADESLLPPGDTSPLLRLETNGPRSYVSGLAFSPDGQHLYATGWDKAVQVWNIKENGRYEYSSGATLRVPTGAGPFGALNALALSSNGKWLATAGQGPPREVPGERSFGWVLPAGNISQVSQLDNGTIYVFNTISRTTTLLRGHRGPVQALAFVQNSRSDTPELVSIGEEHSDGTSDLICRVRFWDIPQAKEIANLSAVPNLDGKKWEPLPGLKGFRPGMTAWSTGSKSNQARVALAWGDDQFRVWDVQTGQVANAASTNNTLTVLPLTSGGERLLTGANAEIGQWSIPVTENGKLAAISYQNNFQKSEIESVNRRENDGLPNAAALIPSRNGNPAQVALVVTRYLSNGRGQYRLVIATAKSPFKTVREIELPWRGEVRQPAIAVSQDGRRIALAGNERNEIEVYQVDDLIGGRNSPPQVLGSVGVAFKDAMFVRSGDLWGLQLSDSRRDVSGRFPPNSLVFDVDQRTIEPSSDKWRPAIPTMAGWSAEITASGLLSIRRPDKVALELKLIDDHTATGYAFCPSSPHCPVPLIAIASQFRGQPLLQLFNGDSGEPLRWCVGHTERIHALTFSEDGRMLVTIGGDRTVCVWTTTDLVQRTLNQHGQIPGLIVHSRDPGMIVTAAPDGLAVQRGDELLAAVRGGEAVELGTAKEFYKFVWDHRPGSSVELKIRRQGELQSVKCEVGQAIDEAKPLFTLFVAPSERKGEWEWIGWNPLGNFDVRGDRVDRWLGWHFNTDDPEHPAKFAAIGEYRDAFYRRDLLRMLIETQKLPPAPIVEDDPKVSAWLRQSDGTPVLTDYEDVPQLEARSVELVANVSGILDRQIQSLVVSIDDAEPLSMKRGLTEREWIADLSQVAWQRGTHRLTVRLKSPNRDVTTLERVHFHPAAPTIEWDLDPKWKREISATEITVNATVIPTSEPIQVQLRLQRPGQDESVVIRSWEANELVKIAESVAIEPGENRLEIVTWNSTAPEDVRDVETASVPTFVRRSTPPMAPRLVVSDISMLSENDEQKPLLADGDTYRPVWPRVRIRGTIAGQAKLGIATLSFGEIQRDLSGFQAGESREFKFDETLTLQPGRQLVVVHAAVGNERDEKRLTFVYEPPAPLIASMTANAELLRELPKAANSDPLVLFERYHEQVATISAVLRGQLEQRYRVTLRVNDSVVADEMVAIDRSQEGQHILTAKIPLIGGKNVLAMRVDNEWTRQPGSRTIELDFRRPPEIVEVLAEEKLVEKPLNLSCRIRSVIPIRSAKIIVDNTDEIPSSWTQSKDSPDEYLLRADEAGLAEGEHVLRITASNDEGSALEPALHKVIVSKPTSKPPVLAIVGQNATDTAVAVSSKRLEIQYTVQSAVPVTIYLRNCGTRLIEETIAADSVPIDGTNGAIVVDLLEGVNDIELTAHNSGGFGEKRILKISYVPPAATVEIVSVDDQRPQRKNDGSGYFERDASKARVQLRARVTIKDRIESSRTLKARIWVNNFKLPTVDVTMDRSDSTIGTFTTEVTLSRPKKNEIKVEVYGDEGRVASELGCTNMLTMDCEKPERRQDLYLVLLGTGNADGLRVHAQAALQAKVKTKAEASQEMWESDVFSQIHVFDALNVHPATAQHRLLNLVRTMNGNLRSASKSGPQAIVMVYFQGQIVLTNEDFTFVTSDSQSPSEKAITGKVLEANLANTYGAHLIFLDLTQNTNNLTASDIWPKAPHLGIIVSNWKGQGQQPSETRLITALEQVLPQIRVVRDLADKIDQRYQLARNKYPEQIETVDRLRGLHDLRIGVLE